MACEGCKYWSESVAEGLAAELLKALCMNLGSAHSHKMVNAGCASKIEGDPIDKGRADPDPFL